MSNSGNTNNATILTIPANSQWIGCVVLSASLSTGIGSTGVTSYPTVTYNGTGGTWNDGDIVAKVVVSTPTVAALSLNGVTDNATVATSQLLFQTRDNPATLTLTFSGSGVSAVATASGSLP